MIKLADKYQMGGSLLGNILLVALFAYGIYLGIQYVPQFIESKELDSMLNSIESQNQSHHYESTQQVEQAVRSILNVNQMDEMAKNVTVRDSSQGISIEIEYERELNLLFEIKPLTYSKTLDLN